MTPATARPLTVAVLGAGVVGRTLVRSWVLAGHRVILGSRQPEVTREVDAVALIVKESAGALTVMLHEAAARAADVVVVTVPGGQVPSLVGALGGALAGKIVIDATNDTAPDAPALNQLAELQSAGALVSRAFNTVGWEQLANPVFGLTRADLPYAGPDTSRAVLEQLIGDVGFRPVYLGDDPAAVETVDALARLWFRLVFTQGYGRRLAWRLLTEADDHPPT